MNSFIAVTTMIAWLLFSNNQQQNPFVEKQLLMEQRAVADTQRTLASDLDAELPRLSFADWFEQVVGPKAGVIWQLSECGDRTEASLDATADMRACVEANTILADGRGVIVRIAVGTFKKGMIGAPAFYFGVIEQEGKLRLVPRLRDLQKLLSAPGSLANSHTVKLPEVNMPIVSLLANNAYVAGLAARSGEDPGQLMMIEDISTAPPLPAPQPKAASTGETPEPTIKGLKILGSVTWGGVVTKAQPRYPPSAKRYSISGPVDVRVTISATGRVTEARAIGGHPLLRGAAEEAARQWVFKPTMLKGVPVETQVVLTFVFKVP
jgi:TonB family protein